MNDLGKPARRGAVSKENRIVDKVAGGLSARGVELTRFRGHLICSSLRAEVFHGQRTEQGETAATGAAHIQ
jgi:hypothetical protein